MTNTTLSEQLAEHAIGSHLIEAGTRTRAHLFLLDYLAIAAAGASKDSARAAVDAVTSWAPDHAVAGSCVLEGSRRRALPQDAALVNGITAHGLELDDTHEESSSHPGVAIWPAILAVAESNGSTMRQLVEAAVVGYDVMCSAGVLLGAAESYGRGFHPTGVAGILGAAAGCARLLGLDVSHTAHALGIAADTASGSLEFLSDGSWTKRLNAGAAASGGVRAALLARAGFTAPRRSFEGRDGWLVQYGQGAVPGRTLRLEPGAGMATTSIKFYPCCRYMHGVMDLMIDLHREYPGATAEDVESVEAAVIAAGQALVSVPPERKLLVGSSVDAQFNMPFGAALAFTRGAATLDDFDNAPDVARDLAAWLPKIHSVTDQRVEHAYPAAWSAAVTVTFRNGTVEQRRTDAFRGSPGEPASLSDVTQKAAGLIGATAAERLGHSITDADDDALVTEALSRPILQPKELP
jgi:2-methylcitrate dehydratase PrpD